MENNTENKSMSEALADRLFYRKKTAFEVMSDKELSAAMEYARGYAEYLFNSKTEREAVKTSVEMLKKQGFKEYRLGDSIERGGRYYLNNRDKSLFAFRIGTEDINNGMRICAAHIDSPRLDLKQNPLYEDSGFAYLKTHYYGGLRKYQWPTLPLALHGTVTLSGGKNVDICIGEDSGDPVLMISDLLPHLSGEQGKKPLDHAYDGEALNAVACASPYRENGAAADTADAVKLNLMKLLNEKYGIKEADFMTAELCLVPAGRPVDIGLDRWLMGGYGHDDKVCAYPALTALCDSTDSRHTVMCVLADKEETGSDGVTGMQCSLFSELIDEIAESLGGSGRVCRSRSSCLSTDVSAAYDPGFSDCFEKRNTAFAGSGVVINKYNGARGKSSTSDASSEYLGKLRDIFDSDGVLWQTAEPGRVDCGGSGTVARFIANHNIDTVDIGVPVISMHAPFEAISKVDLYCAYRAFLAFYR